ncbi:hypothetical protein EYF80_000960 [Liparis tanakae]|uniref:Uncharacterized protein n=1 Tax=Liparis tanakae TaxID=230148 RepID=A0A4Z2JG66_9TELE|nr:hypothetical protein EYF80_000960 [Liparis tanakae]
MCKTVKLKELEDKRPRVKVNDDNHCDRDTIYRSQRSAEKNKTFREIVLLRTRVHARQCQGHVNVQLAGRQPPSAAPDELVAMGTVNGLGFNSTERHTQIHRQSME